MDVAQSPGDMCLCLTYFAVNIKIDRRCLISRGVPPEELVLRKHLHNWLKGRRVAERGQRESGRKIERIGESRSEMEREKAREGGERPQVHIMPSIDVSGVLRIVELIAGLRANGSAKRRIRKCVPKQRVLETQHATPQI